MKQGLASPEQSGSGSIAIWGVKVRVGMNDGKEGSRYYEPNNCSIELSMHSAKLQSSVVWPSTTGLSVGLYIPRFIFS